MDKKSEYDFLDLWKNYSIKSNIIRDEIIQFSDKLVKINKFNWKQERTLLITDKAMYNLKKQELKRRIDFRTIKGVTVSKISNEFVVHCNDIDYDYQYISPRKKMIIEIIAKGYEAVNGIELKIFELGLKTLNTFVTTEKEKQKDQNTTRMPNTGCISVNEYLFGDKNKTSTHSGGGDKGKKNKNFISSNVTLDDFEIEKTIGRGSVSKVFLVKYKQSGEYFAMKSMRKDQIISENIIDNILVERNILIDGQCEFLLSLSFFFQTPERMYFVTPFLKGGDLYNKLKKDGFLPEDLVRFYASQIAIALQYLHDLGIAYRDLKPENILIDEDGYIKLCDFGASVNMKGTKKETAFAGSAEYAAPEIIMQEGHTFMCDWWSFGILLYELLFGITPFFNLDKNRMYELIVSGGINYPKTIKVEEKERIFKVSEDAKNLISKLLEKDPGTRLGRNGLQEIRKHPFFNGVSFDVLKFKRHKALFKPTIEEDNLASNIEEEFLNMEIIESPVGEWIKEKEFENWFDGFKLEEEEKEKEKGQGWEVLAK